MPYIPHTKQDQKAMLKDAGANTIEDFFVGIPSSARAAKIDLPSPLSEPEVKNLLQDLSEKNSDLAHFVSFLGAGAYQHFIPSIINHLSSRAEFYTAYTPYQPEISQGTLQAIYEYQSLICNLTGMDVANASMYDGGSALAEAAALACRHTKKNKIVVAQTVNPAHRAVLKTYGQAASWEIIELPYDAQTGLTQRKEIKECAAIIMQQPNFFGSLEEIENFSQLAKQQEALFIVSVDPISLGILKVPGKYGADIVVGEGQALGNPLSFGGPYLGILATKKEFSRDIPGRLVGKTVDAKGQEGYVLTLQTREQHIRRERATSNICTNEALCALRGAIYLSALGKQGLRDVANLSLQKSAYAKNKISQTNGVSLPFAAPTFKEFVVKTKEAPKKINKKLLKEKIIGGLDLGAFYPELKNHLLIAVTEMTTKEDIDKLAAGLAKS